MIDHRLLDRMQRAVREILDRDDLAAVDLAQQQDAGIERLVAHHAVDHAANDHRAGAAIALGAAFLGANGAFLKPQVIQ